MHLLSHNSFADVFEKVFSQGHDQSVLFGVALSELLLVCDS